MDGNLDYIVRNDAYDSALFPATVRGFYTDLVQRLEEQYPEVVLSVVTDRDTLEAATREERGPGSGRRLDTVRPTAGRSRPLPARGQSGIYRHTGGRFRPQLVPLALTPSKRRIFSPFFSILILRRGWA